jgi:membrane protein required for beta-lactamase induction
LHVYVANSESLVWYSSNSNEAYKNFRYSLLPYINHSRVSAGDFVSAQHKIKDYLTEYSCHTFAILSGAGLGANQCDEGDCKSAIEENKQAIALTERAMVIWIVALALMTIVGVL